LAGRRVNTGARVERLPALVATFTALVANALAQVLDALDEFVMLALAQAVTTEAIVQAVDLLGLALKPVGLAARNQTAVAEAIDLPLHLVELAFDVGAAVMLAAMLCRSRRGSREDGQNNGGDKKLTHATTPCEAMVSVYRAEDGTALNGPESQG
jgi:hypothetical protein